MKILFLKIKFFVNLLRGIPTLNFLKISLFFKIYFFKIKIKKKDLFFKDIFLITSCINHIESKNINYNYNHSSSERLIELIDTIKSIKINFHKNLHIIVCENSKISQMQKKEILAHANEILDISSEKIALLSRKIPNKGVPWSVSVLFSCIELSQYNYDRLHFITGRYKFNDNYKLSNFKKNKLNFKYYNQYNSVSTRYFCYTRNDLVYIFNLIKKVLYVCLLGQPAENGITIFSKFKYYIYNEIGIEGKVNGINFIKE